MTATFCLKCKTFHDRTRSCSPRALKVADNGGQPRPQRDGYAAMPAPAKSDTQLPRVPESTPASRATASPTSANTATLGTLGADESDKDKQDRADLKAIRSKLRSLLSPREAAQLDGILDRFERDRENNRRAQAKFRARQKGGAV